jgi:hypothetical protein
MTLVATARRIKGVSEDLARRKSLGYWEELESLMAMRGACCLIMASLTRLRTAIQSEGAGFGACKGTAGNGTASAFTLEEGIATFDLEGGPIRERPDGFALDKIFLRFGFDLPSFHYHRLLRLRFHTVAPYASFSDQPYFPIVRTSTSCWA